MTQTITLRPLTAEPSGQLVTIDKAVLEEMAERLVEAASAVGVLNGHVLAIVRSYSCTRAELETGKAGPGC